MNNERDISFPDGGMVASDSASGATSGAMQKVKSIQKWCEDITIWRATMDFKTPSSLEAIHERDQMLGKLMLVVSEVAEASEAVRKVDNINFAEELADATIRIFDICGAMGIDLEGVIDAKMKVNRGRHGKHTSL